MKNYLLLLTLSLISFLGFTQEAEKVTGIVLNSSNEKPIEGVSIVNINQVIGTSSNDKGEFKISAKPSDTLHLSFLGFKSIKIRVTHDWFKYGSFKINMTETALALEEVVVSPIKLTGYLEVDIKQVPTVNNNFRYNIAGLPNAGYEAKSSGAVNKIMGSIFNPADFLHRMFGKKPNEMKKLKQMKEDDEIRNLLASRFDREMLLVLLQVDRIDLDEIINQCNYSKGFIQTANDLQILDAISECYEEYKVLNRGKKKY